jgi:two-component system response regulator NreC
MTYDRPINIMLVDDHEMLRDGLRGLLATSPLFTVVAQAARIEEALREAQHNAVDLVVTDLEMPSGFTNGIELTKRLRATFPALLVLIYTMHRQEEFILQAIKARAHGYVVKDQPGIDVIDAINKIVNGRPAFPPVKEPEKLLTMAERQVFWLLGDSKSNEYIAEKLAITDRTVEGHRSSSLQKLRPILQVKSSENELIKFIQSATKYAKRCPFPSR